MTKRKWIQKSIQRKGRTHRYLHKLYGTKAFYEDCTIKEKYLDMGIKHAKMMGETSLERALLEAKTLKHLHKPKMAYA